MINLDLRIDNPYAHGLLLALSDGYFEIATQNLDIPKSEKDRVYVTANGDTLSDIAFAAYGNSKLWWLIWSANDLDFPFELELLGGTELRIPDLENFLNSI